MHRFLVCRRRASRSQQASYAGGVPSNVGVGSVVRLHGLIKRNDLNGLEAVVGEGDAAGGRLAVVICGEANLIAVKPENMELLSPCLWAKTLTIFGAELNISLDNYTAWESIFPSFLSPCVRLLRGIHDYSGETSLEEKRQLMSHFERAEFRELDAATSLGSVQALPIWFKVARTGKPVFQIILDEYFQSVGGENIPDLSTSMTTWVHNDNCMSYVLRTWLGELVDQREVRNALGGYNYVSQDRSITQYSPNIWKESMDVLGFQNVLIPAPGDVTIYTSAYVAAEGHDEVHYPMHFGIVSSYAGGVPRVRSKHGVSGIFEHDVHKLQPVIFTRATSGMYVHFFRPPRCKPNDSAKQAVFNSCSMWSSEMDLSRSGQDFVLQ